MYSFIHYKYVFICTVITTITSSRVRSFISCGDDLSMFNNIQMKHPSYFSPRTQIHALRCVFIIYATYVAEGNACSHSLTSRREDTQRAINPSLTCRSMSNVPASQSSQRQKTRSSQISDESHTNSDISFTGSPILSAHQGL